MAWDPDPYSPHPAGGPYHERVFLEVVEGIYDLLRRFDAGAVERDQLLRGKDDGAEKRDTLNFWLRYQHHSQSERWKCLGQRYWSVAAWQAWRAHFQALPADERLNRADGFPAESTLPRPARLPSDRKGSALVSEHVVPKTVMQGFLLRVQTRDYIAQILRANLCCVVTREEDARLPHASHPDQDRLIEEVRPWHRYRARDILVLDNPRWAAAERAALAESGLLANGSSLP